MHTNRNLTEAARRFRRAAKGELGARQLSITSLASDLGKSRNAVSRAINRGEFRGVQKMIKERLNLP